MLDNVTLPLTYLSAANFTGKQYYGCKLTGDRTVDLCGAGEICHGVIYDEPNAAGLQVNVAVEGLVQVKAGAAFSAGARLKLDASGKWIAAATTNPFYAVAEEAATADGDIVSALLRTGTVP
jgi:hypothetical protein